MMTLQLVRHEMKTVRFRCAHYFAADPLRMGDNILGYAISFAQTRAAAKAVTDRKPEYVIKFGLKQEYLHSEDYWHQ